MIGRNILRFGQVTSTNTLLRDYAERGEPEGLVIAADEQTAGRGRLGRRWIVPRATSLQFSVLLRPPLSPQNAARLLPMAALAVARTLEQELRLETQLKWPNDVLVADSKRSFKKVCGILIESSVQDDALRYAILGIGLNVNYTMSDYPELASLAITVQDAVGHPVDRDALQAALLDELDHRYRRVCRGESLQEEYRARLTMLGQRVRVARGDQILEGIASDVDADGALILTQGDARLTIFAGDVTILKENKEVI